MKPELSTLEGPGMHVWKDRLRLWLALGFALATIGLVACGSDEPDTDSYLTMLRGIAEQADHRDRSDGLNPRRNRLKH